MTSIFIKLYLGGLSRYPCESFLYPCENLEHITRNVNVSFYATFLDLQSHTHTETYIYITTFVRPNYSYSQTVSFFDPGNT